MANLENFHFTFQQKKQIDEFLKDIKMWDEKIPQELEDSEFLSGKNGKDIFNFLKDYHKKLQEKNSRI